MSGPDVKSEGLYARLQRIDTVSYETGFPEPAAPVWCVCIGEFAHEMEHEQAAKNFVDAINARIDFVSQQAHNGVRIAKADE